MKQILANAVLYGFLLWLLYDSTIAAWDPWFAFVVAFVLVLAVVISLVPALRAPRVSPGEYPFDD
jgi:ABC-type lipoprotein release transport system permease subunit